MQDLFDALNLLKDKTFAEQPWCDLDSMVMAMVCYNNVDRYAVQPQGVLLSELADQLDPSIQSQTAQSPKRQQMLKEAAACLRYRGTRACLYINILDNSRPVQFSAMLLRIPGAPSVVCYRGTDNTLTGWREDLHMSFESPVTGQLAALAYLNEAAAVTEGSLILTGHSKGGNLAHYAAAHADPAVQGRIMGAWSFDGPGMDDDTVASEGYQRILPRLHTLVPQGSLVGLMLTYQSNQRLVQSEGAGIQQHDTFTWAMDGIEFIPADRSSFGSQLADRTLHRFLTQCTAEQRRKVVDALFDLLDATEMNTISGIKQDTGTALLRMAQAAGKMDPETLKVFLQVTGCLLQSGAGSLIGLAQDSLPLDTLHELLQPKENKSTDPLSAIRGLLQQNPASAVQQLLHRIPDKAAGFDPLRLIQQAQENAVPQIKQTLQDIQQSPAADTVRSWLNQLLPPEKKD